MFHEFLKGGKYFNVHQGDLPECNSCSTNNICLERLMAQLDFKLKAASTSTVNSIESCILYSNNRTENWLKDKDPKEQQEIIDSARSQNRVFMKQDRERQEELFIKQTKILEQKENEAKRKKERKVNQIDKAIEDMRTVGLWESEEKIKEEVEKLKTKKGKMESLKKQINIYKKVFEINKNYKELLQFSSKGKIYDISKLQQNLTKLITLRRNTPKYKASDLVGKAIIHTWTLENGENKEYDKRIRRCQVFHPNNEEFTLFHIYNQCIKLICMALNNIMNFVKHPLNKYTRGPKGLLNGNFIIKQHCKGSTEVNN